MVVATTKVIDNLTINRLRSEGCGAGGREVSCYEGVAACAFIYRNGDDDEIACGYITRERLGGRRCRIG